MIRRQAGVSLLELVTVIAILAVCAGLAAWLWPSPLGPATAALRGLVLQGRLEAVARGEGVAVVYDAPQREYRLLHRPEAAGIADACSGGTILARLPLTDYRGVAAGTHAAFVWLPTGLGRTCAGGGVFNQTLVLSRGRLEGRVIVSRAGRVRSEVQVR